MNDRSKPSGPVERALIKFAELEGPSLATKRAVEMVVDEAYRRFGFRVGQELSAEEVRNFLRETFPQGVERSLSLVAQEEALANNKTG